MNMPIRCAVLPLSYFLPELHAASTESISKNEPCMVVPKRTSSKMKNSFSGPNSALSPMPVDFRYASARFAIERGSRS